MSHVTPIPTQHCSHLEAQAYCYAERINSLLEQAPPDIFIPIAEGVATPIQIQLLPTQRRHAIQGLLPARPVPVEMLADWRKAMHHEATGEIGN